jgi:hypothetical protein
MAELHAKLITPHTGSDEVFGGGRNGLHHRHLPRNRGERHLPGDRRTFRAPSLAAGQRRDGAVPPHRELDPPATRPGGREVRLK